LVTQVLKNEAGQIGCVVAFGTKHLKIMTRQPLDIIVQNYEHLSQFGLPMATRFDLDSLTALPWTTQFFGCWKGYRSPIIGRLTADYIMDYAFKMLRRGSVPAPKVIS
jgi:hypothetical protein